MLLLREVIQKIDDTNERDMKEALQKLDFIASCKVQDLSKQIETNLSTSKTSCGSFIPITKVLGSKKEVRAIPSKDISLERFSDEIKDILSPLFSQDNTILEIMSRMIGSDLVTLQGSDNEEEQMNQCLIVLEYPAIIRYDFAFWKYNVSDIEIQRYLKDVLSCVVYKSVVDLKKLPFNEFLSFYGPILKLAFSNNKNKIENYLSEALDAYKCVSNQDRSIFENIDVRQSAKDIIQSDLVLPKAVFTSI